MLSNEGIVGYGSSSIIYSKRSPLRKLDNRNSLCELIIADAEEPFTKGPYRINIFHNGVLLGNTIIQLN